MCVPHGHMGAPSGELLKGAVRIWFLCHLRLQQRKDVWGFLGERDKLWKSGQENYDKQGLFSEGLLFRFKAVSSPSIRIVKGPLLSGMGESDIFTKKFPL